MVNGPAPVCVRDVLWYQCSAEIRTLEREKAVLRKGSEHQH